MKPKPKPSFQIISEVNDKDERLLNCAWYFIVGVWAIILIAIIYGMEINFELPL